MSTDSHDNEADTLPLYDSRNYRRAPATMPGVGRGVVPVTKGNTYPSRVLSADDVGSLIDACDDTMSGLRLRAFIAVLYRTGMKIAEALKARTDDLELRAGHESIFAAGANVTERRLVLDSYAMSYLGPWLEARRRLPGDTVFCVFDGPTAGRVWDAAHARHEMRLLGKKALGGRANTNSLRLTMAAELIVEQWPLTYIQTQLGLTSVWSFREIFPQLGVVAAPEEDVAEVARSRPLPMPVSSVGRE